MVLNSAELEQGEAAGAGGVVPASGEQGGAGPGAGTGALRKLLYHAFRAIPPASYHDYASSGRGVFKVGVSQY